MSRNLILIAMLLAGCRDREWCACRVTKVYACLATRYEGVQCRVDCAGGLRLTSRTLVAEGDYATYLQYTDKRPCPAHP